MTQSKMLYFNENKGEVHAWKFLWEISRLALSHSTCIIFILSTDLVIAQTTHHSSIQQDKVNAHLVVSERTISSQGL